MKRILAALGLALLVGACVQTGATATPRDTPTCVRDYRVVPCVARTWHKPANAPTRHIYVARTWHKPTGAPTR